MSHIGRALLGAATLPICVLAPTIIQCSFTAGAHLIQAILGLAKSELSGTTLRTVLAYIPQFIIRSGIFVEKKSWPDIFAITAHLGKRQRL